MDASTSGDTDGHRPAPFPGHARLCPQATASEQTDGTLAGSARRGPLTSACGTGWVGRLGGHNRLPILSGADLDQVVNEMEATWPGTSSIVIGPTHGLTRLWLRLWLLFLLGQFFAQW